MIRLKGMTWNHPRGYAPLDASREDSEKIFGLNIEWDRRSLKDFGDAPIEKLSQIYDLLVLDHPHMGVAAESGCLLKLDELLTKDEIESLAKNPAGPSHESHHYRGHQWALAVDAACQVASMRKDLMGDNPSPSTWEDVFALSEKLKASGKYIGMAFCPTDCNCTFLTLCAQAGDAPTEGRREYVREETGIRVLKHMRKLKEACHPHSPKWNPIQIYDRMSSCDDIAYCPLAFGYTNYSRPNLGSKKISFIDIPHVKGALLGGAGIAISKHCQHIELAANYVKWICGSEYQRGAYTRNGGQPGNGAAWNDPEADAIVGGFFSGTRQTIENAYTRPRFAARPKFQEYVGDRIHAYLTSDERPEKCFRYLADQYQTLVLPSS